MICPVVRAQAVVSMPRLHFLMEAVQQHCKEADKIVKSAEMASVESLQHPSMKCSTAGERLPQVPI